MWLTHVAWHRETVWCEEMRGDLHWPDTTDLWGPRLGRLQMERYNAGDGQIILTTYDRFRISNVWRNLVSTDETLNLSGSLAKVLNLPVTPSSQCQTMWRHLEIRDLLTESQTCAAVLPPVEVPGPNNLICVWSLQIGFQVNRNFTAFYLTWPPLVGFLSDVISSVHRPARPTQPTGESSSQPARRKMIL